MAGSGLNTRCTMVNPYYIFKHKFNNHLPVLATLPPIVIPTITQWSGSPKLFDLKQVLRTLAKPFLWLQTQAITKSNTSNRWEKESQRVMNKEAKPRAQLHLPVIQSADTSRSRLINASFQAQDQHEPMGAKVTSFLSEGALSNLAKDNALMPPPDGITGNFIPPLIQWSSIGLPIKSSYIKPFRKTINGVSVAQKQTCNYSDECLGEIQSDNNVRIEFKVE